MDLTGTIGGKLFSNNIKKLQYRQPYKLAFPRNDHAKSCILKVCEIERKEP